MHRRLPGLADSATPPRRAPAGSSTCRDALGPQGNARESRPSSDLGRRRASETYLTRPRSRLVSPQTLRQTPPQARGRGPRQAPATAPAGLSAARAPAARMRSPAPGSTIPEVGGMPGAAGSPTRAFARHQQRLRSVLEMLNGLPKGMAFWSPLRAPLL